MKCIECEGKATVTDSVEINNVIFRRRKCQSCNRIFYTEESQGIQQNELFKKFWKVRRGEEEA